VSVESGWAGVTPAHWLRAFAEAKWRRKTFAANFIFHFPFDILHLSLSAGRASQYRMGIGQFLGQWKMPNIKWKMENEDHSYG
jgi:hypothetical protein